MAMIFILKPVTILCHTLAGPDVQSPAAWHDYLIPCRIKKQCKIETMKTKQKKSADNTEKESMLLEFFHGEIKDIYWAEKHLLKAIPKMSKAATAPELKEAFDNHLEETKGHVERLEQVFELLGFKPQTKKCEAMEGITKEGDGIVEETESGTSTRDVGLILAGQKVKHSQIATYGGRVTLAQNRDK